MLKKLDFSSLLFYSLFIIIIFIPLKELLSLSFGIWIKILPDLLLVFLFIFNFKNIKLVKTDYIFILFFISSFISTVFINDIGLLSFVIELRSMFSYYFLFIIMRNLKFSTEREFKLISAFEMMALITIVFSFVEKIFNKAYLFPYEWIQNVAYESNLVRVYGLFNNPNTYAAFLLFIIILINYFEREFNYKSFKFFNTLAISAMILTISRSALIGLSIYVLLNLILYRDNLIIKKLFTNIISAIFIAIIISFAVGSITTMIIGALIAGIFLIILQFISIQGDSKKWVTTLVTALIFASIINGLNFLYENNVDGSDILNRFTTMFDSRNLSNSATDGRIHSIVKGIDILSEQPLLGTGFGTYGDAASLMNNNNEFIEENEIEENFYADNEYIKILVETGIFGSILFVTFIVFLLHDYIKDKYKLISIFIFLFLGLFYNVTEVASITLPLYFLLATSKEEGKNE